MTMQWFPPAIKDMSAAWYAFMGIDREAPPAYAKPSDFAKAPADEAWVYSCVRRIYQSAQGVPLRVYGRTGNEELTPLDQLTGKASSIGQELQDLLDYVNPVDMTGTGLKAYTAASMAVWGESYWRKVRGRLGGPPQELYWLRAPDMEDHSSDGRNIVSWEYHTGPNTSESYKPADVVPFRSPNMVNPRRGLSPLSSVGNDIQTLVSWATRSAATPTNDSVPPGFWQIPREAEFTPKDESLVRRTLRALRGPKNRGKVPIMPQGLDFKAIALTPVDAEMIATKKVSRMAVCAALGVPLVLAGDDEKSSVYANLRDAERVFWRGTMVPALDGYADVVNNWLVPDFDPSRKLITVAFDYSDIEALRPTLDVEWNMWISAVYAQAITPNRFIKHFRLGAPVPWGDQPTPRTAVAIRPDPAAISTGTLPVLEPGEDAPDAAASPDATRSAPIEWPARLYRDDAVKQWLAVPTQENLEAVADRLGVEASSSLATGLTRRYSAAQLLDGVPSDGFAGLTRSAA